jgi:hypothetical protein
LDNGTPKVAFVTPAGWRLESGTSTISGQVSTFGNVGFAEASSTSRTPARDGDHAVAEQPGAEQQAAHVGAADQRHAGRVGVAVNPARHNESAGRDQPGGDHAARWRSAGDRRGRSVA